MAELFQRNVSVKVGTTTIELLRIDFEIQRRTTGESPGGTVTIYNLGDKLLYSLAQRGLEVTVSAGYGERTGEIFRGRTQKAQHMRKVGGGKGGGMSRQLQLDVRSMSHVTRNVSVTGLTYTSRAYAQEIGKRIGAAVDVSDLPNVNLRSMVHSGVPASKALQDLCDKVAAMVGYDVFWQDYDGVIEFSVAGRGRRSAPRIIVSPLTGLIGSPEPTDDNGQKIHTLLNHEVRLGSEVTLTGLGRTASRAKPEGCVPGDRAQAPRHELDRGVPDDHGAAPGYRRERMSNARVDESLDDIPQILAYAWKQWRKEIHTALPGVVQRYSARNRRVDVQPQIKNLMTDYTAVSRPVITDVPVVTFAGGGIVSYLPLQRGDNVLLIFAMRDISEFKQTYREATPLAGILEMGNAIAIPGFGPLEFTPADEDAFCLQTEDGTTYVTLKDGVVELKRGSEYVRLEDGNVQVQSSGTVTLTAASETLTVR